MSEVGERHGAELSTSRVSSSSPPPTLSPGASWTAVDVGAAHSATSVAVVASAATGVSARAGSVDATTPWCWC